MNRTRRRSSPGPWLLTFILVIHVSGCTSGRVAPVGTLESMEPPLKAVALAPAGGVFADLIGMTLAEHGYTVIDTGATAALLVLTQQHSADLLQPQGMEMLRRRGIDAVLVVDRANAADGLPQTVHVRLHSTATRTDVGGIDWENSWFRRGVLEAAQEIAAAIAQLSTPPNGRIQAAPGTDPPRSSEQSPVSP
jgi:hypothetical protein